MWKSIIVLEPWLPAADKDVLLRSKTLGVVKGGYCHPNDRAFGIKSNRSAAIPAGSPSRNSLPSDHMTFVTCIKSHKEGRKIYPSLAASKADRME